MSKTIWTILIIVVIIILGIVLFGMRENEEQLPEPLPLADDELPQDALPLDELPEEYLEEQTAPVGSDVDERIAQVLSELHTGNSGDYVRQNFPDLEYLFDHTPEGQERRIFPFFYYYSAEADTTFVVCNINKTVAVCDGKQDTTITAGVDDHKCDLAEPFEENFI